VRRLVVGFGLSIAALAACSGGQPTPDAHWPLDGQVDAGIDAGQYDAEPDARVLPDVLHPWDSGPPIDAAPGSVIQLPPSGQRDVTGPWHQGRYVVYSERRYMDHDVFLYDLVTHVETAVATEIGKQMGAKVFGAEVMWSDGRWYSEQGIYEVFQYNIDSTNTAQITSKGVFTVLNSFTDSYVLCTTTEGVPSGEQGFNLVLFDRATQEERVLATYDDAWEGASMSDTHVAWVAPSPWEGGFSPSVYVHEIAANVTTLLLGTVPGRQLQTSTWGDYVVWSDDRNGNWDIYAYRLSTAEEWPLVTEPHDQVGPQVADGLVGWIDYRWGVGSFEGGGLHLADLVIHDLENDAWRRATGWSDEWGFFRAQGGHLVYSKLTWQDFQGALIFAMDLEANGIIDGAGRVIP
jgi:beta propeller repeat protein